MQFCPNLCKIFPSLELNKKKVRLQQQQQGKYQQNKSSKYRKVSGSDTNHDNDNSYRNNSGYNHHRWVFLNKKRLGFSRNKIN